MKTVLFIATFFLASPAHACDTVAECEWDLNRLRAEIEAERVLDSIGVGPRHNREFIERYVPSYTPRYYTPYRSFY